MDKQQVADEGEVEASWKAFREAVALGMELQARMEAFMQSATSRWGLVHRWPHSVQMRVMGLTRKLEQHSALMLELAQALVREESGL